MRNIIFPLLIVVLLLLTACAKEVPPPPPPQAGPLATVVLLADPSGHVGTVVVTDIKGGTALLDRVQYAVHVQQDKRLSDPFLMPKADIERDFGQALKAFPDKPITYILYFKGKTTTLTAESLRLLNDIGKTFRERKSTDISIVGHTDRVGAQKYNLLISEKRAQKVSKLLFKKERIPWMSMEVLSLGELFPMVPTDDNKSKQINRRVEVTIR